MQSRIEGRGQTLSLSLSPFRERKLWNFDPSSLVLFPSRLVKRHQNLPSPVPHYLPDTLFLGQRNAYIRLAEHYRRPRGYLSLIRFTRHGAKHGARFVHIYIYIYGDCSKPISRRGMISRMESILCPVSREKIGKLGRPTCTPMEQTPSSIYRRN